eukprot:CAMPEP_0179232170 /NCGR_PEP_ID=MMETSP0797-20121207/11722_1 /TAXON_ID=47934 /ORGANISM="Dinophysis acuminata, Strain DAEP01" /LENGTH=813 /DNA_ID=CAMNT_0020939283 /DNA_START=1 /DNA_END=2442 /DNA_ORIENTATION=-
MDEIPASEFDGRDFDAREVVQRYRKRVPLPQLQKGLQAHHTATRQELVELINEKYADFVSLSSRMQGVERALKPLRAPLEESSTLTQNLNTKLGALLEQAEETHKGLTKIRARKDALAVYIENAKLLDKAKADAGQRSGNPQESADALREHVVQENVARDLRRIRLNLSGRLPKTRSAGAALAAPAADRGAPRQSPSSQQVESTPDASRGEAAIGEDESPECQALLEETAEFEVQFAKRQHGRLHALVVAAKRLWDTPSASSPGTPGQMPSRSELMAIAHICRALVTIGRADAVEGIFTDVMVKDALDLATKTCTSAAEESQRRAMAAEPGSSGMATCVGAGAVDLKPFFDSVCTNLLVKGSPLLWLSSCFQGDSGGDTGDVDSSLVAVPSLRLVANAIAVPVLRHVQQVWPNVFMPAFCDIFAANYLQAANFVTAVMSWMPPTEKQEFTHSVALTDFQRRWKTAVYSSLRGKDAVGRLEAAAASSRADFGRDGRASQPQKHTAANCEFWLEVSAELMRLLTAVWGDRWYLDVLFPKMVQLSLELLARYGKILRGLVEALGTQGGGDWDPNASPPAWGPGSLPVRLSRAAADMLAVRAELLGTGHITGLILGRLPDGQGERPKELVHELLRESGAGFEPTLGELEVVMLRQVTAATTPQFAAIRGIPAFYRMLNKPVPTKASPYVESAMRPIQALRDAAAQAAPPDATARWVQQAVDGAANEFSSQAAQLLESTHQQEASLRRLAGRGGTGGEVQVSDLEKIHIQLCLDVETFTNAVSALGVTSAQASGLKRLADVVLPLRQTYEAHRPATLQ